MCGVLFPAFRIRNGCENGSLAVIEAEGNGQFIVTRFALRNAMSIHPLMGGFYRGHASGHGEDAY